MTMLGSASRRGVLSLVAVAALVLAGAAVAADEGKERPLTPFEIKEKVASFRKKIAASLEKMKVYADKAGEDDVDGCEASKFALGKTLATSADEAAADLARALEAGEVALAHLHVKRLEQAAENAGKLEDAAEVCAMGSGGSPGALDRDVSGQTGAEEDDIETVQDNLLDFGYDPDDRVVSPF